MPETDEWPTMAEELGRKLSAKTIEILKRVKESSMTPEAAAVVIGHCYDCVSGLAEQSVLSDVAQVHKALLGKSS